MPALLKDPEGLARVHRAKLPGVADEHDAGNPERAGDAKEPLHLHRADHRRLVDREHRARIRLAAPGKARGVRKVGEPREEPLERPARDPGLSFEHADRARRWREALPCREAREPRRLAEHRRLARAGMALNPDEPVPREREQPERRPLPVGEPRRAKHRLDPCRLADRAHNAPARPHHLADPALGPDRPSGHERAVRPPALRLEELALAAKARDRAVDLVEGVPPRRVPERERLELGLGEDRRSLLDVGRGKGHRLEHAALGLGRERPGSAAPRTAAGAGHLARGAPGDGPLFASRTRRLPGGERRERRSPAPRPELAPGKGRPLHPHPWRRPARRRVDRPRRAERCLVEHETDFARRRPPPRNQLVERNLLLGGPGPQGRLLRELRGVRQTVRRERLEDLPAPARVRFEVRPFEPRNLEPRIPPHQGGHDRVAERLDPPCERIAVDRADELLASAKARRLKAPPLPTRVPRHVEDHAVRVHLRLEVAVGQVPESRDEHPVGPYPGPLARRGVVAARLEHRALEPLERFADRLVVHPKEAARRRRRAQRSRATSEART